MDFLSNYNYETNQVDNGPFWGGFSLKIARRCLTLSKYHRFNFLINKSLPFGLIHYTCDLFLK